MIERRFFVAGACAVLAAISATSAQAFETRSFDAKAFEAAQPAGKPILIEVTAPWCPTCKAQKPILSTLSQMPKFHDLVAFQIDFDSQKDLLKKFDVFMQ